MEYCFVILMFVWGFVLDEETCFNSPDDFWGFSGCLCSEHDFLFLLRQQCARQIEDKLVKEHDKWSGKVTISVDGQFLPGPDPG